MIRKAWFASFFLLAVASAKADPVNVRRGRDAGANYEFRVNLTPPSVEGRWGDRAVQLTVDVAHSSLDLTVNGKKHTLVFTKTHVQGTLPCGVMNIGLDGGVVRGSYCGEQFDSPLGSNDPDEAAIVLQIMIGDAIFENFPQRMQEQLDRFVFQRVGPVSATKLR